MVGKSLLFGVHMRETTTQCSLAEVVRSRRKVAYAETKTSAVVGQSHVLWCAQQLRDALLLTSAYQLAKA